jgi:outer membrane lipoprotein-sorting protein
MRLWVDVETNLPVQIEVEMLGMEAGQMSSQRFVMENFEWNESVDESIFVPDIPDDYTLVQ